jgi:hypothetical protein
MAGQILFGVVMAAFPAVIAVAFAVAGIPEAAVLMGAFAAGVGYFLCADAVRS